ADRAEIRPPRRIRVLQRLDVPSHRAEFRHPGGQPRRQRIRRRAHVHARRGQPLAARPGRRRHLDARTRHRRRADLRRPRRQPAPRSHLHRLRPGPDRHGCRRPDPRRRRHRAHRHPAVTFSRRVPHDLSRNRLTDAVAAMRAEGRAFVDLTATNPTCAGFSYPPDLLAPLAAAAALEYRPEPLGSRDARVAVANDYARRGVSVPPERVVLTASTSEAYSVLFKLLADAGDEILIPRPSYPLFDHLAALDLLVTRAYDLEYHGAWTIDVASVERALTPRTRAILIVSPNNPTGSYMSAADLDRLAALCAARDVAIVADEVFADYELEPGAARAAGRAATVERALTFALGGLSKSIGLPQVKLGWMAVSGPARLVASALDRLELICDTYLSASTP